MSEMAQNAGIPLSDAEVAHVLDGKTCDGHPLPTRPSFPSHPPGVEALLANVRAISIAALNGNPACLRSTQQRTQLIRKLISYLVATHTPGRALDLATIDGLGSQIAADPHWHLRSGIQGLLRRLRKQSRTVDIGACPPEPLLYAFGKFRLVELIHPAHLVAESHRTGNCLGTSIDANVPESADLPPDDLRRLTYWRRIAKRKSRIFSVRLRSDAVVASVEYLVATRTVSTVEFSRCVRDGHRAVVSFLVRALSAAAVPLDGVNVPYLMRGKEALTDTGEWRAHTSSAGRIIGGWVTVGPELSADRLHALLHARGLHVEIERGCDDSVAAYQGALCCGSVQSQTLVWPTGVTDVACRAFFPNVERATCAALETVKGMLVMNGLLRATFPALTRVSGVLEASEILEYAFPKLKSVSGLLLLPDYRQDGLPLFDAPRLAHQQSMRSFDEAWNA